MTENIFKQMEEAILKNNKKRNDVLSDYWLTPELEEKGWEYDNKRAYIPFDKSTNDEREIFISISRKNSKKIKLKYIWCYKKDDDTWKFLVSFKRNNLINEEDLDDETKSSINKKIASAGSNSGIEVKEDDYISFFNDIFNNIISSDCLDIFKDEDYKFQNKEEELDESDVDLYLLEVAKAIEYRQNPVLDDIQNKQAQEVEECIAENGLIKYLKPKLDKLHIGEHKNIYRKLLGAFNVMRGKGSYLWETTAHAEEGKSLEDKIVFSYLVPEEYIFAKNNMSEASFVRYSDTNIWYFTRLIILWGDFGSKNAYNKIQDVFDIIKILITENEYSKDLSEKSSNGNFNNKSLDLKVESIGGAYSTTLNSFTDNDPQLESRTVSSTPFDTDKSEIMDYILYLNTSLSTESKDRDLTIDELVNFKSYLLSLVSFDKEIINPYGSVFKKYVKESNTPIRELQQLIEFFDAYCILTYHDCNNINGTLVASEEQVKRFFSDICLENVLIPYESNFIKMLLAKGKQTELVIINDSTNEDSKTSTLDPLNIYFNKILENMKPDDNDDKSVTSFADLGEYHQKVFINKLLQLYKLGGASVEHKKNVFFRLTDVKRLYYRYKDYKNIDDVGKLLHILHLKGYLGKLDFIDPNTKQNIYYITSACKNITIPVELDNDDREEAKEFLRNIGLGDAD